MKIGTILKIMAITLLLDAIAFWQLPEIHIIVISMLASLAIFGPWPYYSDPKHMTGAYTVTLFPTFLAGMASLGFMQENVPPMYLTAVIAVYVYSYLVLAAFWYFFSLRNDEVSKMIANAMTIKAAG
jgi:hypothetical protein